MKHSIKTYRRWARMHKVEGNHRQPLLVEHAKEHDCQNCGTHYRGNFCPNCGQSHDTQRFTIGATVQHVVFFFAKFDSSFWRTCAELFYRPGHMIRDYIQGHRVDYFRPVQMLVCLTTAYILLSVIFHKDIGSDQITRLEEASDAALQGHTIMLTIMDWVGKALHSLIFINLATVVFCVIPNWFCFRRTEIGRNTNLAEHFYILVYVTCQAMIVDLILFFPLFFMSQESSQTITTAIEMCMLVWVLHQYFKISWWRTISRVFVSFLIVISMVLAIIFAILFMLAATGHLK